MHIYMYIHTHTYTFWSCLHLIVQEWARMSRTSPKILAWYRNNTHLHHLRRNDVLRVVPIHGGHLRTQSSQKCVFCPVCQFLSAPESTCSIQRASSCLRSRLGNRVQIFLTIIMELQAKLGHASHSAAPCCSIAGHTFASTTCAVFTLRSGPAPCVVLL